MVFAVTLCLLFSGMMAAVEGEVGGEERSVGEGIKENETKSTQEIHDWHDLDGIRDDLSGDYILRDDIDKYTAGYDELVDTGEGWGPIEDFTGSFDGNGYRIFDLYIDRPDTDYVGLFGYTDDAVLSDVGVVDADVSGVDYIGALVGDKRGGTISESYTTGDVSGDDYVAGLVGHNTGTVSNSYTTATVNGDWRVGGITGWNFLESTLKNLYATGDVSGESDVGALVGYNTGTVSDSFSLDSPLIGDDQGTQEGRVTDAEESEMKDYPLYTQTSYSDYDDLEEPWDFIDDPNDDEGDDDIWDINDGYPFLAWEKEILEEHTLTINIEGEGTTDPYPDTHTYKYGEEVNITAFPDFNWHFNKWTGDIPEEERKREINLIMEKDRSIVAHFAEEVIEVEAEVFPTESTLDETFQIGATVTCPDGEGIESQVDSVIYTPTGKEDEIELFSDGDKYYEASYDPEEIGTYEIDVIADPIQSEDPETYYSEGYDTSSTYVRGGNLSISFDEDEIEGNFKRYERIPLLSLVWVEDGKELDFEGNASVTANVRDADTNDKVDTVQFEWIENTPYEIEGDTVEAGVFDGSFSSSESGSYLIDIEASAPHYYPAETQQSVDVTQERVEIIQAIEGMAERIGGGGLNPDKGEDILNQVSSEIIDYASLCNYFQMEHEATQIELVLDVVFGVVGAVADGAEVLENTGELPQQLGFLTSDVTGDVATLSEKILYSEDFQEIGILDPLKEQFGEDVIEKLGDETINQEVFGDALKGSGDFIGEDEYYQKLRYDTPFSLTHPMIDQIQIFRENIMEAVEVVKENFEGMDEDQQEMFLEDLETREDFAHLERYRYQQEGSLLEYTRDDWETTSWWDWIKGAVRTLVSIAVNIVAPGVGALIFHLAMTAYDVINTLQHLEEAERMMQQSLSLMKEGLPTASTIYTNTMGGLLDTVDGEIETPPPDGEISGHIHWVDGEEAWGIISDWSYVDEIYSELIIENTGEVEANFRPSAYVRGEDGVTRVYGMEESIGTEYGVPLEPGESETVKIEILNQNTNPEVGGYFEEPGDIDHIDYDLVAVTDSGVYQTDWWESEPESYWYNLKRNNPTASYNDEALNEPKIEEENEVKTFTHPLEMVKSVPLRDQSYNISMKVSNPHHFPARTTIHQEVNSEVEIEEIPEGEKEDGRIRWNLLVPSRSSKMISYRARPIGDSGSTVEMSAPTLTIGHPILEEDIELSGRSVEMTVIPTLLPEEGDISVDDGDVQTEFSIENWKEETVGSKINLKLMDENEREVIYDDSKEIEIEGGSTEEYTLTFSPDVEEGTYFAVVEVEEGWPSRRIATQTTYIQEEEEDEICGLCGGTIFLIFTTVGLATYGKIKKPDQ